MPYEPPREGWTCLVGQSMKRHERYSVGDGKRIFEFRLKPEHISQQINVFNMMEMYTFLISS